MKKSPRFTPKQAVDALNKYMLQDAPHMVIDFERSEGAYFYDALSEREYLDLYTFFASLPLGFNHPGMKDSKFLEDIKRAGVCKPANSDVLSVEYAEFVDTFHRLAAPKGFDHLFFISGGALAVENALKTAFDWKIRKNLKKGIKDKGYQVIHFNKAFHGRSGYTLSLTNTFDPNKTKFFPKFNWPRVINPVAKFPLDEKNLKEVETLEKKAVEQIKKAFQDNPDDIAAIIVEPIQGEGGDNHFRKEFFQSLRTLADENEAMLIFDEVQAGMGLTGRMWCFQHFDMEPDIIVFGKKTQIAGIMCNSRVDEVDSVFKVHSRINSTFGGNLVDMIRCARYLEIMDEENLVENADNVGRHIQDELIKLADQFEILTNVRGKGLMIAFDLPTSQSRDMFRAYLLSSGCMVLPCGEKSIRLRPPLNLTMDEANKALNYFHKGLQNLYSSPAKETTTKKD